jgi:aspartate kinase
VIVMKFGGSSVADADRILAVTEIVRRQLGRRPLVVVSALGGVTDLLVRAVDRAAKGDREGLDPVLAELERMHRWAITGSVEETERRHQLSLEVDRLIDDLRRRLRSIRILGEATPRAADAVLAFGEDLSSRILAVALADRGLAACSVDPRKLLVTDGGFGGAEPDAELSREACVATLRPLIEREEIPVLGGFVGATRSGETTTLGRGGSDTTAAFVGLLVGAEEIQIWTDVDGLMSADPRLVPTARRLASVSFAEAAELACHGAQVLHADSIAPAVKRCIPVRVLNSLRPDSEGTLILDRLPERVAAAPVAVASRRGVVLLRIRSRRMRGDSGFLPRVLDSCGANSIRTELVSSSRVAATLAIDSDADTSDLERTLASEAEVDRLADRAMLWIVGSAVAEDAALRRRVLEGLSHWDPEVIAAGVSPSSVAAVVVGSRLEACLRDLHRRFFEEAG